MPPYERIVQWMAGPTAAIAGWLATQLINHVNIFGTLGLGKSQVAHAIVDALTFGVTALITYAAHHKWLSNLPQWWDSSGLTVASGLTPSDASTVPTGPPTNGSNGGAPLDPTALAQLIATQVNDAVQLRFQQAGPQPQGGAPQQGGPQQPGDGQQPAQVAANDIGLAQ